MTDQPYGPQPPAQPPAQPPYGQQPPPVPPQQAQTDAQRQVEGIGADLGPGPQAPPEDLGAAMQASGAHPGEVDAAELLKQIRALQSRVDAMEADKRSEAGPDVVRYAQALADHVAAKVTANPVTAADPDMPGAAGTDLANAALAAAKTAAESGNTDELNAKVQDVVGWVRGHAAKFSHIDWTYVLQLAEEIGTAAAKLAA